MNTSASSSRPSAVILLDVLGYLGLVGGSILVMRVILEIIQDDT